MALANKLVITAVWLLFRDRNVIVSQVPCICSLNISALESLMSLSQKERCPDRLLKVSRRYTKWNISSEDCTDCIIRMLCPTLWSDLMTTALQETHLSLVSYGPYSHTLLAVRTCKPYADLNFAQVCNVSLRCTFTNERNMTSFLFLKIHNSFNWLTTNGGMVVQGP